MTSLDPIDGPSRRYLLLSPNLPYPQDSGANQRTFLLFKALEKLGHVDFIYVGDAQVLPPIMEVLKSQFNYLGRVPRDGGGSLLRRLRFSIPLIGTPLRRATRMLLGWRNTLYVSPGMSKALEACLSQKQQYDAVVTRYLWTACQTGAIASQVPVLVDVDDLESEIWFSRAAESDRSSTAWCSRRLAESYLARERQLLKACQGVWVAKTKDVERTGHGSVGVLPNIPFAAYPDGVGSLSPAHGKVVLGVALFDWQPNKKGFDWFVRQVWPQIHAQQPDAELHLVGRLSDATMVKEWQAVAGVRYLGRVDDLTSAYQRALITVAPIFSGGGTNIKVIESLAYGRPCVVSPHAAKGFEDLPGLLRADDSDAFVRHCVAQLTGDSQVGALGLQASHAANQRFSFSGFGQVVADVVGAVEDRGHG